MLEDYREWYSNIQFDYSLTNALSLPFEPLRGWTHVIMAHIDYVPRSSTDYRQNVRITRCGVFKWKDVVPDIARFMSHQPTDVHRHFESKYINCPPPATGIIPDRLTLSMLVFGTIGPAQYVSCESFCAASLFFIENLTAILSK